MEIRLGNTEQIDLKYITDGKRHLICVPYSVVNLHIMAEQLDINPCWFHKNHYDIPKLRIKEIESKCTIVDPKNIVEIIRSPDYADIILSDMRPNVGAKPKGIGFEVTQILYDGGFD